MSNISKKPGEEPIRNVKNEELLPSIFRTEINKKMLDSSLNLMTSKGKMMPFYTSYGVQSSSDITKKFVNQEQDPVRAESQANVAFIYNDSELNYVGKTSYVDLDNYFKVKGLPLPNGTTLDKDIKYLDLPIDNSKLVDYNMYHWISHDLPLIRIHVSGTVQRLFITDEINNLPFATLTDDITGKELTLENGMRLFFTGAVDADYLTPTIDIGSEFPFVDVAPVVFVVTGVGKKISLIEESYFDKRIPTTDTEKRMWDENGFLSPESTTNEWDADVWDGTHLLDTKQEYLVMQKYDMSHAPWSISNHWYHINVIRKVSEFLDMPLQYIANATNKATRPIIEFINNIKLFNWPNERTSDSATLLAGYPGDYTGLVSVSDETGYTIEDQDIVFFSNDPKQYIATVTDTSISFAETGISASLWTGIIISKSLANIYKTYLYNGFQWQEAQNKTSFNQCPLFELYDDNNINLGNYPNSSFQGAKILDFAIGTYYDPVLERNIKLSNIEFDFAEDLSGINFSGVNQLKFYTEVDKQWSWGLEDAVTSGVNYYKLDSTSTLKSFWIDKVGLRTTLEEQQTTYTSETDLAFSSDFNIPASGFDTIHLFSKNDTLEMYFFLEDYGTIRFSTVNHNNITETFIPIIKTLGLTTFNIKCHGLPFPVTFYQIEQVDGYSVKSLLSEPFAINNGTSDGVITLNIDEVYVDEFLVVHTNPIGIDSAKLIWQYGATDGIAIMRPIEKFKFIVDAVLRDKTTQLYNDYDLQISVEEDSPENTYRFTATSSLNNKATTGDKLVLTSPVVSSTTKTAPLALKSNPLNQTVEELNYYSLFQSGSSISGSMPDYRSTMDHTVSGYTSYRELSSGTFTKNTYPLNLLSLVTVNSEIDLVEALLKQGKHYDTFMTRFRSEINIALANASDITTSGYQSIISTALSNIYLNQNDEGFWYHSNMIGWGDSYTEVTVSTDEEYIFSGNLEPISYTPGKELITHVLIDGRILKKEQEYGLTSNIAGYYTGIVFDSVVAGKIATIRQWPADFASRIPASLSKIGLSPLYRPHLVKDTTLRPTGDWYLIRHDGTRYYLADGVEDNNLAPALSTPANIIDSILFEYEKMVWSSVANGIAKLDFTEFYRNIPGYFRKTAYTYSAVRDYKSTDLVSWLTENKIFVQQNINFDLSNPFTYRYELGEFGVTGSWREIYKFLFDTDRPHSHPWEMTGSFIKPDSWDSMYSWTDPTKRAALLKHLRTCDIRFARYDTFEFPVDINGNLLPPTSVPWINSLITNTDFSSNWAIGDNGPVEQVYNSTHRALAIAVSSLFLTNPTYFVNELWRPGEFTVNEYNLRLSTVTDYWPLGKIDDNYHTVGTFTSGLESMLSEFYKLENINFYQSIIAPSNNVSLVKEILLGGFTNKSNVRIQSTSINSQRRALYVPEENYSVRTLNHYKNGELFYSAMRVVYTGQGWVVTGFTNENPYFVANLVNPISPVVKHTIGSDTILEKTSYIEDTVKYPYGTLFSSKQELFDFIKGYGIYLEQQGFIFDYFEHNTASAGFSASGDVRDWKLSAKQFIKWTNDPLLVGNYIDLNPAVEEIKLNTQGLQIDDLSGTNKNVGICVDNNGKPVFSSKLIVSRGDITSIKLKDATSAIYGIKFTTSIYESVLHLDPISVFGDVYFQPEQQLTKKSFLVTGKKTVDWTGKLYAAGYFFYNGEMYSNFDNLAARGKGLYDIETSLLDPVLVAAAQSQFGLDKNPELRQLFLTDVSETQFKNSIAYTKGTIKVFNNLEPLSHINTAEVVSTTTPYEEYMVRIGELGNTKNTEFYEFQLKNDDVTNERQILSSQSELSESKYLHRIQAGDWVHTPYGKRLEFTTTVAQSKLAIAGPIASGDTDFAIQDMSELSDMWGYFEQLWAVPAFDEFSYYKQGDKVRVADATSELAGNVYKFVSSQGPKSLSAQLEFMALQEESFLPNIFVSNYKKSNPNLLGNSTSLYTPGTWQLLQTMDAGAIIESCPGTTDLDDVQVTTVDKHGLSVGDYVMIVNTEREFGSVNGIWAVTTIVNEYQFNIPAVLTDKTQTILGGKLFAFRTVRFASMDEMWSVLNENAKSYVWKNKRPAIEGTTTSGFSLYQPLIVVDEQVTDPEVDASWDSSGYAAYNVVIGKGGERNSVDLLTYEMLPVSAADIEHVIVYDYATQRTVAKLELFDPKNLIIPQQFLNEVDLINRVDPARYNRTSSDYKAVYLSTAWQDEYVGKRWWDTSTISFVDYEQGTIENRAANWGKQSPGSTVDIYEWTKSSVHPSYWASLVEAGEPVFGEVPTGTAFVQDLNGTESYHWTEKEELNGSTTTTVYYFWVKNKDTTVKSHTRNLSVLELAKNIINPSFAGLAWCAPLSNGSLLAVGLKEYLNETTVVQIKRVPRGGKVHHQWIYIADGNQTDTVPEYLHVRFRDSISNSHIDLNVINSDTSNEVYVERKVPNVNLHKYNTTGNSIRPYIQSWFSNLFEARRTMLIETNRLMSSINLTSLIDVEQVFGSSILINDSNFDMTPYWNYATFTSPTYDSTIAPAYVVSSLDQVSSLYLNPGEYVRVINETENSVYESVDTSGLNLVWKQNGTIAFKDITDAVWSKDTWDGSSWDNVDWDDELSLVFFNIMEVLRNDVFVVEHKVNYNKLLCVMFRYILSEQMQVDWLAKSSTIQTFNQSTNNLTQITEFERDSTNTLTDYYKNVKSFHDKLRYNILSKDIDENADFSITDSYSMSINLNYSRFDEPVALDLNSITGLDFTSDSSLIDMNYSGIPIADITAIVSGLAVPRYELETGAGEELLNLHLHETSLILDVTHNTIAGDSIRIRNHYRNLMTSYIMMLDAKAATLLENVTATTDFIKLNSVDTLPDATVESPSAVWIGNERISYTVKTTEGITGLTRATNGTSLLEHNAATLVYPESEETLLPVSEHFGQVTSQFFADAGSSLEASDNAIAAILMNNVVS